MKSTFATTLSLAGALALAASATPANAQCAIACGEASATSIVQVHNHGREAAPAKDIVSTAVAAEDFTVLASLLEKTGLVEVLQGDGPFTVFAPTDEAFAKVPEETVNALLADKDLLRSVLLYHVVSGEVLAEQVVGVDSVATVQGTSATVTNGYGKVKIDNATIIATDVIASNGVIHVIDSVIIPQG